jgi:hypothetical protein
MKSLFMTIAMAAALTACGHRASTDNTADADSINIDSTAVANETALLKTDSIGIELTDTMVEVRVSVDWPVAGNDTLVQGIRQYIAKELEIKNYADIKAALQKIAKKHYNELANMWKEDRQYREDDGSGMTYSSYQRIFILEESDTYVTYSYNTEGFTGGAHGYATATGTTISKATGRIIGYESVYNKNTETFIIKNQNLFRSTTSAGLYKLIKEGVKDYFSEFQEHRITDEELADVLQNVPDVNHIPVPQYAPTFSQKGLLFLYQQYEIGPYAVGMPNFCIPYDAVKPYLTDEAAALIK